MARVQLRAAAVFDSGPGKCVVTAAILIDFLAAVPARACSAAVRRELERIEARGGLGRVLGGAAR